MHLCSSTVAGCGVRKCLARRIDLAVRYLGRPLRVGIQQSHADEEDRYLDDETYHDSPVYP
jgi:hypothetical protein